LQHFFSSTKRNNKKTALCIGFIEKGAAFCAKQQKSNTFKKQHLLNKKALF
jgi:hypothetical protein